MTIFRRILSILVVSALSLCAADVTGKWTGSVEVKQGGQAKSEPAFVILKQEGTTVTGSGGPQESDQKPLRNGKVEGNQLTFEITLGGERVMRFHLTAAGDQIDGDVSAPGKDASGETVVARLVLKRVPAQ